MYKRQQGRSPLFENVPSLQYWNKYLLTFLCTDFYNKFVYSRPTSKTDFFHLRFLLKREVSATHQIGNSLQAKTKLKHCVYGHQVAVVNFKILDT